VHGKAMLLFANTTLSLLKEFLGLEQVLAQERKQLYYFDQGPENSLGVLTKKPYTLALPGLKDT